jgi:hypothetical protein
VFTTISRSSLCALLLFLFACLGAQERLYADALFPAATEPSFPLTTNLLPGPEALPAPVANLIQSPDINLLDAAEPTTDTTEASNPIALPGESLGQAAKSPESPLPRIAIMDAATPTYWDDPGAVGNTVYLRAWIPWSIAGVNQLSRFSLPITTLSPGNGSGPSDAEDTDTAEGPSGLGDLQFYDVTQLRLPWGRLSLGADFSFPTGTNSGVGNGKWEIGPAFGFASQFQRLQIGFFSQSFFAYASETSSSDNNITKVQPILDFDLGGGWSIGTSQMDFEYSWSKKQWTDIPLGIEIGKTLKLISQDLKLSAQAEYNFASASGNAQWTYRFTLTYVFPKRLINWD